MTWSDLAAQVQQSCLDTFGSTVTYTRLGVSSEITAIFDAAGVVVSADGSAIEGYAPFLGVRLADLPDVRAAHGDTWTVDSETYEVVGVDPDGQGAARLRGQKVS